MDYRSAANIVGLRSTNLLLTMEVFASKSGTTSPRLMPMLQVSLRVERFLAEDEAAGLTDRRPEAVEARASDEVAGRGRELVTLSMNSAAVAGEFPLSSDESGSARGNRLSSRLLLDVAGPVHLPFNEATGVSTWRRRDVARVGRPSSKGACCGPRGVPRGRLQQSVSSVTPGEESCRLPRRDVHVYAGLASSIPPSTLRTPRGMPPAASRGVHGPGSITPASCATRGRITRSESVPGTRAPARASHRRLSLAARPRGPPEQGPARAVAAAVAAAAAPAAAAPARGGASSAASAAAAESRRSLHHRGSAKGRRRRRLVPARAAAAQVASHVSPQAARAVRSARRPMPTHQGAHRPLPGPSFAKQRRLIRSLARSKSVRWWPLDCLQTVHKPRHAQITPKKIKYPCVRGRALIRLDSVRATTDLLQISRRISPSASDGAPVRQTHKPWREPATAPLPARVRGRALPRTADHRRANTHTDSSEGSHHSQGPPHEGARRPTPSPAPTPLRLERPRRACSSRTSRPAAAACEAGGLAVARAGARRENSTPRRVQRRRPARYAARTWGRSVAHKPRALWALTPSPGLATGFETVEVRASDRCRAGADGLSAPGQALVCSKDESFSEG
eukprot:scaffold1243_cov403-Prasinococcus_capsulatus_cf.AAC.16